MTPALLIASREFRTYVATASFWIALGLGPLLALAASAVLGHQPAVQPVRIEASSPELRGATAAAVIEAARLEAQRIALSTASGPAVEV